MQLKTAIAGGRFILNLRTNASGHGAMYLNPKALVSGSSTALLADVKKAFAIRSYDANFDPDTGN